jgi:CheY-like chemotaxis protein
MGLHRVILVVDDDQLTREVLRYLLEDKGYEVLCAANGQEALALLHNSCRPLVILLDLGMPIMTGRQFRAEQQRDPELADIPVVIISGESHLRQSAAALGGLLWFAKPIEFDELLQVISRLEKGQPVSPPAG